MKPSACALSPATARPARLARPAFTLRGAGRASLRLLSTFVASAALLAACGGSDDTASATTPAAVARAARQAAAVRIGTTVQYVRLQALSEVNGNAWASMAEFNLVDANGATLARTGWSASADSQETVGENAPATNALDADTTTFWHTQWQGATPPMPHAFTVNLGSPRAIGGFRYLPRQVGVNGRIAAWNFYTSTDGATWTLASSGTFPNGGAETTVMLNHAPTLTAIADRMDPAGQSVTQAVAASDADGDTLSYAASDLPAGLTIAAGTGLISGTPTAAGSYAVTLAVSDGLTTTSGTFNWTIAAVGGVGITARYVRLEATSEVNGNPWTSVAEFNVVDSGGSVIPHNGWTVSADSQETAGENAPATNAIDGDPNTFWHTQWQGATPPLPHALTVNLGALRSIGGFKYLPRQNGVNGRIAGYRFYTSSDGATWTLATNGVFPNGTAEATVNLTAPANRPPALGALANRTDPIGQAVTQAVTGTDPDGNPLTYAATGLPTGLTIAATSGTISGTPTTSGTFAVTVTVGDGSATASGGFTWTVAAAPVTGMTARYVRLEALSEVNGNPWASMAEFNLVDAGGATLSRAGWTVVADSQELVGENAPATNAIDGNPATFWHTQWLGAAPPMPHTFTVNLGASQVVGGFRVLPRQDYVNGRIANYRFYTSMDGVSWQVATQGTFTAGSLAVQAGTVSPNITNRPPSLASLPATRTDGLGASVNLAATATDPDGDALTYAAAGLPDGLTIGPATGVVSGTATRANTYAPTISVVDGHGGSATQTFNWIIAAPAAPTGASGTNPPIVFNATTTAAPGDVVSLQGDGFGTSPTVYFDGYPATPLAIVDRVGTNWLAVQIPTAASGALVLRINNGTGVSAAIALNAARPHHLDTTLLNAGGAFRLFGRNLKMSGSTPTIKVNGVAASIDLANSDEHMLSATVPTSIPAAAVATVVVDNGNGTGPSTLDRPAGVVVYGSADPFALGVGWGAAFTAIASRSIYPATDSRIGDKAACNGSHDDSGAIQAAIDLAASAGGGVVQLPAGRCATSGILTLRSNVVVRGAGKTTTEIYHTVANYPVIGQGVDLAGLSDLTVTNAVDNGDGMLLKDSTRVFVKNLAIRLGTSRQMYLSGNVNFVFGNTDVVQTGNANLQGPYTFNGDVGLVYENGSTQWVTGAPTFGQIHDSSIRGGHFTRNAGNQNVASTVHSLTLDFGYRLSVIGNLFDVGGGPITNKQRNDGETILTEGGGASRTENVGTVGTATATTMTDASNTLNVDPFGTGSIPENYGIAIVSGKGMGQTRHLVGYAGGTKTATIDRAWDVVPDGSSHYATFVYGLEKALIKANTLSQNPRGVWLYNTGIRDVDVIANTITDGGGIYLRSYQNIATKTFTPIYGVLIRDNVISNTAGQWMSYINAVMVNGDGSAFGTGIIGVEVRNNTLSANRPNVTSGVEEYANFEGLMARMPLESGGYYEATAVPRVLGPLFLGNACNYCDVAFRIGTGAGGTVISGTRPGWTSLYTDTSSVPTGEKSTGTVVR